MMRSPWTQLFVCAVTVGSSGPAWARPGPALDLQAEHLATILRPIQVLASLPKPWPTQPLLADLAFLRADVLQARGVDLQGPVRLTLSAGGVWLLEVRLADPKRFEAWAEPKAAEVIPVESGEPIRVFDPNRPAACRRQDRTVRCQIGVDRRQAGFRRLIRPIPSPDRAGRSPWRLRVRPPALGAVVKARRHADAQRRARWVGRGHSPPSGQPDGGGAALRWHRVESLDVSSFRTPEGGRFVVRAEARLTEASARRLTGWLGTAPMEPALVHWAESGVLMGFWARVGPQWVAPWFAPFREAPAVRWAGGLGGLILGVDGGCPMERPQAHAWRYAFPSVLAAPVASTSTTGRWRGRHGGAPYEIHVAEDVMWVGTGRGAGAAAKRLWRTVSARAPSPPIPPEILGRAHLDVAALRAALRAAQFRGKTPAVAALQQVDHRWLQSAVDIQTVRAELRRPRPRRLELEVRLR